MLFRSHDADFGLAVTGWTHTDFRETTALAPRVFIALDDGTEVDVREINVGGDPAILKSRVAKAAMNLLRLRLLRK